MSKLALAVNPMSGRDVRRLAARATNMTHEAKRDIVARVAAGADAVGVTDIYVTKEPFRIAAMALQMMPLRAKVHVIEHELHNNASDTERSMAMFREAGCSTVVSLGGDGTNRAIVRASPDIDLVPLSTGTNNVFPVAAEPTIAGMVAGLSACGRLRDAQDVKQRAKVLHVQAGPLEDLALIDAVLLRDDHVGNLLPFDADRIERIALARAEPNSVGMSPIGGLRCPVHGSDDFGLVVDIDPLAPAMAAPLSPGLFKPVHVGGLTRLAFDDPVMFRGPGVVALDGDRDIRLEQGQQASITLRRDGPSVIDIEAAMRWSVGEQLFDPAVVSLVN